MTVVAARQAFAAEIEDVDLRTIDNDDFSNIYRAWLDHSVLLFRGHILTDRDLIAFSQRFGDLDLAPVQESGRRFVEGHPEIYVVSNVMKNGEPIGSLGAGEAAWHTDMSYLPDPPKASILYALEVPPAGGNTYFCNMYHAYESLPEELKRRTERLMLKHDGTYNSGGYVRQGVAAADEPFILSSARTLKPSGARCTWGGGATPTLTAYRFRIPNPCSTSCGPTPLVRNSPGTTNGVWATSSSGTTGAPCTGVIPLTKLRGGSCTALKLKVKRAPAHDRSARPEPQGWA
jgi:hypothetical protein